MWHYRYYIKKKKKGRENVLKLSVLCLDYVSSLALFIKLRIRISNIWSGGTRRHSEAIKISVLSDVFVAELDICFGGVSLF